MRDQITGQVLDEVRTTAALGRVFGRLYGGEVVLREEDALGPDHNSLVRPSSPQRRLCGGYGAASTPFFGQQRFSVQKRQLGQKTVLQSLAGARLLQPSFITDGRHRTVSRRRLSLLFPAVARATEAVGTVHHRRPAATATAQRLIPASITATTTTSATLPPLSFALALVGRMVASVRL